MIKPRYKHDCKNCKIVGQSIHGDIWICTTKDESSIIIRKSNKNGDYYSAPIDIFVNRFFYYKLMEK